jgi:hypothetical protein
VLFISDTILQDLEFCLKYFQYFYIERVYDARKVWEALNYKILIEVDVIYKSICSTVKMSH